jgi:CBS domain-containing protein
LRALELAEPFPVVHLDTDAMEATRLLVDQALPGLVVVDQDGLPLFILPGSQVLRFALPDYVEEDRALASVVGQPQRLDKAPTGPRRRETEGIPTAIRFAIWRSKRRNRGRRMVEYRRRLLEYYESP